MYKATSFFHFCVQNEMDSLHLKQICRFYTGLRTSRACYKKAIASMGSKMSIQMLSRWGAALFLIVLTCACTVTHPKASDRGGDCKWNRSSCLYEGAYEPGEANYAEQEARRLNQAESVRIRRSGR